jgi:hypothetical protein
MQKSKHGGMNPENRIWLPVATAIIVVCFGIFFRIIFSHTTKPSAEMLSPETNVVAEAATSAPSTDAVDKLVAQTNVSDRISLSGKVQSEWKSGSKNVGK